MAAATLALTGCWADFPSDLLHEEGGLGDITIDGGGGDTTHDLPLVDSDGQPVGDSTVDTTIDGVVPADFSCTPGEFLGCTSGNAFLRCAPSGTGTTRVDCAPATCSASAKRCDQCTPGAPPVCDANAVRTCSPDGLFNNSPCPSGCANGVCCADKDSDGASCNDCDDGDARAHPGQNMFFDTPRATAGGYDFNCNGNEEQEITTVFTSCRKDGGGCAGDGWVVTVPACGATGSFVVCQRNGGACLPQAPASRKQRCR